MKKDFDTWSSVKKNIHEQKSSFLVNRGEIWWCSIGVNVGAEVDGKNKDFERPIIIMRVYNRETAVVLPLTKKEKNDVFHHRVLVSNEFRWIKLTQTRVISSKRLVRKIGILAEPDFKELILAWKNIL